RFTQLAKQTSVLNGDIRLIREGRHELCLLVRERAYLVAGEHKNTNCRALSEKRHAEASSVAECLLIASLPILGVVQHVRNMNCPTFHRYPPGDAASIGP